MIGEYKVDPTTGAVLLNGFVQVFRFLPCGHCCDGGGSVCCDEQRLAADQRCRFCSGL